MKKLSVILLATFALGFMSCSTNELEVEQPQEKLLKSYTLKRDASGSYSMDYNVSDKVDVNTVKNNTNTNEIILSQGEFSRQNKYSNQFSLENDKLKIGFFDANTGNNPKFTVMDENITFARGTNGEFLKDYSVTANEDGTFVLNFSVNNNVQTEFIYNESNETYEVHLSRGSGAENFSRDLELSSEGVLRIDFVNHKTAGRGVEAEAEKKPRLILDPGEDSVF